MEARAFCKDVGPGEGRLAECLAKRVQDIKQGNVVGRRVGAKCQQELLEFKMDRGSAINKDVPLGEQGGGQGGQGGGPQAACARRPCKPMHPSTTTPG